MARSLPSPPVFSASTELSHRPLGRPLQLLAFKMILCFPVKALPVPLFPYFLVTDFLLTDFLLPSHFSWPFYTHTSRNPSCFLFLCFCFIFLSILFTRLVFSMLFSPFLLFLSSLLIIFSCTFLSYPYIHIVC